MIHAAKALTPHPIANLFPMMSSEELSALVYSMRTSGFDPSHPIITYEGQILDGRNRFKAAQLAGVEPVFREWTEGDPWSFVWRDKAVRRHLEASQKAAIAIDFARGSEDWRTGGRSRRTPAKPRPWRIAHRWAKQPRDDRGRVQAKPVAVPRDTATEANRDHHEKGTQWRRDGRTAGRPLVGTVLAPRAPGERKARRKRVPIEGSEKMTELQAKRAGAKIAADVRAGKIVFEERPRRGALPCPTVLTTVRQVGEDWTNGELLKKHGAVNRLRVKATAETDAWTMTKHVYQARTRGPSGPSFGDLPRRLGHEQRRRRRHGFAPERARRANAHAQYPRARRNRGAVAQNGRFRGGKRSVGTGRKYRKFLRFRRGRGERI